MLRRNVVRSPKMDLRHLPKRVWSLLLNQLFSSSFHARGNAALETGPDLFSFPVQPVDKTLARQNRCRRNRDVRFSARPLLNLDLLSVPKQRLFDQPRISELI